MRKLSMPFMIVAVFAVGFLVGRSGVTTVSPAYAQATPELSEDATNRIKAVFDAVALANTVLANEVGHSQAIKGPNTFAVTVGGIDSVRELEEGRGVDPETFAGLYAGLATDEVKSQLAFDEDGQLTYKGKLIRMYSTGKLKRLFAERLARSGAN